MNINALPYTALLGFLFGSTLIASRFSVGQYHPTTYIGLRMIIASLSHLGIFLLLGRWPRGRRVWKHATVLGVAGTAIPITSIVSSLQYQSSGLTAIFLTVSPAIVLLLAHAFLPDETLTRRKAVGVALALSGALLLAMRGESGLPDVHQANPLGIGLVTLALLSGSSATVYARRFMRDLDPLEVSGIRMFVAALVVMPLSVLLVGFNMQHVDLRGYQALAYAALVGTFLGMLLQFYIVKRFGATTAAMTTYVIPIVAALGGALMLRETITPGMTVGMVVIIVGISIINLRGRPAPQPENI